MGRQAVHRLSRTKRQWNLVTQRGNQKSPDWDQLHQQEVDQWGWKSQEDRKTWMDETQGQVQRSPDQVQRKHENEHRASSFPWLIQSYQKWKQKTRLNFKRPIKPRPESWISQKEETKLHCRTS